jgi:hypothetical protein
MVPCQTEVQLWLESRARLTEAQALDYARKLDDLVSSENVYFHDNLARAFLASGSTPRDQWDGWLASPPHRTTFGAVDNVEAPLAAHG